MRCRSRSRTPGEETLLGSWAELAATSPGAHLAYTHFAVAAVFPQWAPLNNAILVDPPSPYAASAAAAELADVYRGSGVDSWALWLPSSQTTFDAADNVTSVDGMRRDVTTVAMTLDLAAGMPLLHARVQRTTAAAANVAGESPVPVEDLPAAGDDSDVRGWVLTAGAHAIAGAWTFRDGQDVGVYAVGTVPQYRRRGIARALMLHVLADAYMAGARTASLQSTPMGAPLYASLGFRAIGRYEEWVPAQHAGTHHGFGDDTDVSLSIRSETCASC